MNHGWFGQELSELLSNNVDVRSGCVEVYQLYNNYSICWYILKTMTVIMAQLDRWIRCGGGRFRTKESRIS